jgi:hypothetical protein
MVEEIRIGEDRRHSFKREHHQKFKELQRKINFQKGADLSFGEAVKFQST